jgi:uncharacterized membrane protein
MNVLAINFTDDADAYQALTTLKELDEQGQIGLEGAAVVLRHEDGSITIKDEVGDIGYEGAATGGIVGLIVGILGGPIGVLLGGATGVLVGSSSTWMTSTRPNRSSARCRGPCALATPQSSPWSTSRAPRSSTPSSGS